MNTEHEQQTIPKGRTFSFLWGILFFLMGLLTLGAIGASAYLWQQAQQSNQKMIELSQHMEQVQQQIVTADGALDKQQDQLALQNRVLEKLSSLANQRDQTLILAEAEYLTRLAYFSLHFERNIPQAILLLQTANQRIVASGDATFLKLRSVLTQEITALQAVKNPDIAGILLKLNALSAQINQLPLFIAKPAPATEAAAEASTLEATPSSPESLSIWRRSWDKTWDSLKNIVVIKHQEVKDVVPPAIDRTYIDQHLQSLMAQAQWGLMRQQEALYVTSLNQGIAWITQYYDVTAQPTKALLEALKELVNININPAVPDLTPSFELIRQLLNQPVQPIQVNDTGT